MPEVINWEKDQVYFASWILSLQSLVCYFWQPDEVEHHSRHSEANLLTHPVVTRKWRGNGWGLFKGTTPITGRPLYYPCLLSVLLLSNSTKLGPNLLAHGPFAGISDPKHDKENPFHRLSAFRVIFQVHSLIVSRVSKMCASVRSETWPLTENPLSFKH